ncbi:MFS transporter [Candidatus Bathyarchaeota archaeon]|nr:MAG: MFS transporter [Candidatus Bathyarchaeota archaeon]
MGLKSKLGAVFSSNLPKVYYELLFVGFSIMTGMSLSSSFLSLLADQLDPSGALVGMVVSAWFLSRIFLELPAGIISDRIGRRKLLVIGLGLAMLGPILCSQATHIYILIIGRSIWGMGTALYFMSNMALLMDILPVETRGSAIGMFQGIENIGSFIGAPVGALLATQFSFTKVFYFTIVFTLISFVVALRSSAMKDLTSNHESKHSLTFKQISGSLRNWSILIVCVCVLLRMLVIQGIFQTVLQLYLNKNMGLSVGDIGWVISMKVAGQIIFLLIAGYLSDKYGRKPVLAFGFGVGALSIISFILSKSFAGLLLSGFLGGVGEGLGITTLLALLTDIAPANARGGAVGLYRTFMDIGGFFGPIIFMILYTRFTPLTPFYVATAIILVNISMILITKTKPAS